jgi:hypothetical protein
MDSGRLTFEADPAERLTETPPRTWPSCASYAGVPGRIQAAP